MTNVVLILHFMFAVAVIGVIVLQGPKGEGLGSIGGGGARLFHGPKPRETLLLRVTSSLAVLFGATSLYLVLTHYGRLFR
ncbi:MAG TPA: preprotein translocase subunit SecG [bacterium]|nr:preprotein translocase subunit SecG [bacterium]